MYTYIHTYIHTYRQTDTACVQHINVGLTEACPKYSFSKAGMISFCTLLTKVNLKL